MWFKVWPFIFGVIFGSLLGGIIVTQSFLVRQLAEEVREQESQIQKQAKDIDYLMDKDATRKR